MKLLAIILAFGLFQYLPKPLFMNAFNWLNECRIWLKQWFENPYAQLAMVVAVPVFVVAVLMAQFFDFSDNSVGYLLIHVGLLYYCLGPQTVLSMIKQSSPQQQDDMADDVTPEIRVGKITDAALHRWFGVFFWYVVLNVYGALIYRFLCHLSHTEKDSTVKAKLTDLMRIIEYPVIVLMTVSLALASDFDRIWKHCKQYLTIETLKSLNSQFMYKSMDFAVEQCEIEENDENQALIIELTTYKVLKRMLVVWLVFSALMVIFSIG